MPLYVRRDTLAHVVVSQDWVGASKYCNLSAAVHTVEHVVLVKMAASTNDQL
jgi:hypothetical protein